MFAVVESGSIVSMPKGNRGIQIGDLKYSSDIFTVKWTEEYYINTNITYAFGSGKVTGTYGTATAKEIADKTVDGVLVEGLKTIKKRMFDNECAGLLAPSDWMVVKATETGTTMDSGWKTWRASVRTKCNSMQTQIDNAANVDALAALFTYTTTDGVTSRPLGEFPVKE